MRLEIPSNPSTGYDWRLKIAGESIELTSYEYVHGESDLTGSGGTAIYVFESLKPGEVSLVFENRRGWEEEVIEVLEYDIAVSAELSLSLLDYRGSYPDYLIPLPIFTDESSKS